MRGRSLVVSFANGTALCCANFTRVPSSDISATTTVTVYGSGSTTSYNRTVTVTELQQTTTVTISRNVSSYATTVYVTVGPTYSSLALTSTASAVLIGGGGTVIPNLSYITTSTVPGPAVTTVSRTLRTSTIQTTSPTNGGIAYELTTSALTMRLPGPPATTITTTGMLTVYRLFTSGINGFSVVS